MRSLHLHDAPSRHKGTFHTPKAWRLDSAPCHAVSLDQGFSPCPTMHQLCAGLSIVLPKFVFSDFVLFEMGVTQHNWPPAPSLLPPSLSAGTITGVHRHTWDFPGIPPYSNGCVFFLLLRFAVVQVCVSVSGSHRASLSGTVF